MNQRNEIIFYKLDYISLPVDDLIAALKKHERRHLLIF